MTPVQKSCLADDDTAAGKWTVGRRSGPLEVARDLDGIGRLRRVNKDFFVTADDEKRIAVARIRARWCGDGLVCHGRRDKI